MSNPTNVFTTGSFFSFNGAEINYLTGLTYNRAGDKVEATTVYTTPGYKEYRPLRSEATLDATFYFDSSSADIPLFVEAPVTASFAKKLYKGQATAYSMNVGGKLDGMIEQTYNFTFNGGIASASASN